MDQNKSDFPKTIDEYIAQCNPEVQEILRDIRSVIREAAPEAKEKISYGMPAFAWHGILVYFAAFKNHIGFFPTADGVEAFRQELTPYKTSKGTIQFPMKNPIPYELIKRIVRYRVAENAEHAKIKEKNA